MQKLGQRKVSDRGEETLKEFEQLYFKYHGRLVLYANKYLQDMDQARDVVQEAFYSLWQKSDTFAFDDAPKAYLFQAVKNRSLNALRQAGIRHPQNLQPEDQLRLIESQYLANSDTPFSSLLEEELEQKMNHIIDSLPEKCRMVFKMSRYDDMKNREIAEKLDISVKMVEKQISKALRVLREELADYMAVIILFLLGM